jgi:hypothetical protein
MSTKNKILSQVLMAHACNPSHSVGRDQEDCGLKPVNSFRDPILKKTHHQKGLVNWLKVKAPSSSPVTQKKRRRRRKSV